MATNSNGAVFFLGSRAHYEVLEQPNNYDAENGNTSTETIYQGQSVEEMWPNKSNNKRGDLDANYNPEAINWNYCDNTAVETTQPVSCVKRRTKRHSSETLLCDEKPTILNIYQEEESKTTPSCRVSLLNFLTSLARSSRKRNLESDQVHYLQHFESVFTDCTYRESCRCLDCQSRYFECDEESDEYSSDNDYCVYSQQNVNQDVDELDDDVFINPPDNDNTSTDLLLDDRQEEEPEQEILEEEDTDKQLQMEVAASTSAMFNILLYHPFSCSIQ